MLNPGWETVAFWCVVILVVSILGVWLFTLISTFGSFSERVNWQYRCRDKQRAQIPPPTFFGTVEEACDRMTDTKIFRIDHIDYESRVIDYSVDWLAYNEKIARRWSVHLMGEATGAHYYTATLTRSEAIAQALGHGSNVLARVDDTHAIIFIRKNT